MSSKITYEATLKHKLFIRDIDIMERLGLEELKPKYLNIDANLDGSLMVQYKDRNINRITEVN